MLMMINIISALETAPRNSMLSPGPISPIPWLSILAPSMYNSRNSFLGGPHYWGARDSQKFILLLLVLPIANGAHFNLDAWLRCRLALKSTPTLQRRIEG